MLKYILIIYLVSFIIDIILYKKIIKSVEKHKGIVKYLGNDMSIEEFVSLTTILPILNTCLLLGFIKSKIWP